MSPSEPHPSRRLKGRLLLGILLSGIVIYFLPDSLFALYSDPPKKTGSESIEGPSKDKDKERSHPKKFDYVPGEVLVKFRKNISSRDMASIQSQVDTEEIGAIPPIRVRRIRGRRGQSTEELIAIYSKRPEVEYAEPNGIVHTMLVPNDSRFSELWGMNNIGQTGGTSDADIDGLEAWDLQTGSANVIVADIDTGVDYNHPDLAANMWTNPGEIAGNGIDDDGNGFIDDVRGWNFVNNTNNPMDDFGHGTHTAGTIAAAGNNGTGVVGVNWRAKIMPVKFLDSNGSGTHENTAKAILYASQMGAKISSNSYGCGPSSNCFSQTVQDALEVANQRGMLFVVAAGNSSNNNDNNPTYPCNNSVPNVLCVAATDHNDQKAGFSNYGITKVHLGAPGVSILSTVPTGSCELCDPSGYKFLNGTSMATPHVAGAAALLLSQFPGLTADQLKSVLTGSVDLIPSLAGKTRTGGRLNVNNAIRASFIVTANPPSQTIVIGQTTNFTVNLQSLNNFSEQVTLSLTSSDPSITGNFSPNPVTLSANGSIQANLTVTTTDSATRGVHLLTVSGTSPLGETRSTIIELDLLGPDFTISINPTFRTMQPSSTATFYVSVNSLDEYSGPVTLSLTATHPNISGSFSPNPVMLPLNNSAVSILTIAATSLPIGSYTLTTQATDGVKTHSQTVTLTVDLGAFSITGSLQADRAVSTATLLPNGKVLIAGGVSSFNGALSSAELYDPATGMFISTGSMGYARYRHTATILSNGRILIAGGKSVGTPFSSAELYDQSTGNFTPTGSMVTARSGHTATLLQNGKVLITGGIGSTYLASAELYNPVTGTFIPTGSMAAARFSHTATLLSNGKVLIAGGYNDNVEVVMAELYDPDTGSFSPAGSMNTPRSFHTATLLLNGNVLIAGGGNNLAELYNPTAGLFSPTGSMLAARKEHTATLLTDGNVLITGGSNNTFAELYNPATGLFSPTGSMLTGHGEHTATLLTNGNVLIAAGGGNDGWTSKSAELYSVLDAVSLSPVNIITEPSVAQSFTAVYSDPGGYQNISDASIHITDIAAGPNNEWAHYNPQTNSFTLQGAAGSCSPGEPGSLATASMTLNCSASTASGVGTTLTVVFNLTPQSSLSGAPYQLIISVTDQGGESRSKMTGYWVVDRRPTANTLMPINNSTPVNTSLTFTATYSDADGYQNISDAGLYFAAGANNEWIHYSPTANNFSLMGVNGSCTAGQSMTLSSPSLRLNCATSSGSGSGANLTVNFNVTPLGPAAGRQYLQVPATIDSAGKSDGKILGTWTITSF